MILLIENGLCVTDLDAAQFNLLNVGDIVPLPDSLVSSTDPRLSDARVPLDGSVTNASVSPTAGIVQSKLNLNGQIPTAWLGTTSTTAAEGDLAEYVANKGVANGYASLDGGGKVPNAQLPTGIGNGTVTSVGLTMPAQFTVSGSPITGAGTIAVSWATVADQSWFGNKSGGTAAPQFYTTALPVGLIPSLDASQVTSGTFAVALLPVAIGLGGSHAPGAVPDPGPGGGGALATDYLARDMTYKAVPTIGPTYQPTLTSPTINPSNNVTGARNVTIVVTGNPNANIFYSLTGSNGPFTEFPYGSSVSVGTSATIWAYGSDAGYNNSAVVSYTNPNP